jgi:hypothetical protein
MYTLCTLLMYELVCRMLYMSNTLTLSVKEGQASKLIPNLSTAHICLIK